MRASYFLLIIGLVFFFYGLVPFAGALFNRYKWRQFRRQFDKLRLRPMLDYGIYRQLAEGENSFRFIGGFESVTDGETLWIQSDNLTIPVSLKNAQTYILPMQETDPSANPFDHSEEAPERIKWERVSALADGAKVFVGGDLVFQDGQWIFVSSKESPLMVIFYDGSARSLAHRVTHAGRNRNEYWNAITPYSLALGAASLILIAFTLLHRPAFRLTVISAIVGLFVPLLPLVPPGILFTTLFRRLSAQARMLLTFRDLARLPLCYLAPPENEGEGLQEQCKLSNGETYGIVRFDSLPQAVQEEKIPLLLPEKDKDSNAEWYVFGALCEGEELPTEPADPFATFGALPGRPDLLAKPYAVKAYILEVISWGVLFVGIALNIFFVGLILTLL